MLPTTLTQQLPLLAVMAMALAALFALLVKVYDARISDLKSLYDQQLAARDKQLAELGLQLAALRGELEAWHDVGRGGTDQAERFAGVAEAALRAAPVRPPGAVQTVAAQLRKRLGQP